MLAACLLTATGAQAQNSTRSPYSQFGYGVLSQEGGSYNKGMDGLGIAMRSQEGINTLNPASYSAIDSLTFIFDMGMSAQFSRYTENGASKNARTASFDYAYGAFRIFQNAGMAFGIRPFSTIGYNYYNTTTISTDPNEPAAKVKSTNTYTGGDGLTDNGSTGLREVFLGAAWKPVKYLSFGVEGGYMWGASTRKVVNTYSATGTTVAINSMAKVYYMKINTFNFNAGLQVMLPIGKTDNLTLGATYKLGHSVKSENYCNVISTYTASSTNDTTKFVIDDKLRLPHGFGVGIAYNHGTQLTIGADYSMQKWGSLEYPIFSSENNGDYDMMSGQLKDRHKFTLGGQWQPNPLRRSILQRIRYRFGVSYTTPYIKINGQDGPKELSATLGFGIPIFNNWNNRSVLNISMQYSNVSATGMIKEQNFRINIGFTFNERWFMKWKVE